MANIPNLRAIRDWVKELCGGVIESVKIGEQQYYLDFKDDKWGVNTDPKRGADTFTPFKENDPDSGDSGEGSGDGTEGGLQSPITITGNLSSLTLYTTQSVTINFGIPKEICDKIKRFHIVTASVSSQRNTSSSNTMTSYLRINAKKKESTSATTVNLISAASSGSTTSNVKTTKEDEDVDISEYEEINYLQFYRGSSGSTGYITTCSCSFEIELYF